MPPAPTKLPRRGAQSGQAIVLITFIMIGLLGALGLAIDGGGMMFMYRDLQNATDAAVVAATYARCTNATSANVVAAGMRAAADSGFNNDGVTNWVTVSNPPPPGQPQAGNDAYIHVAIRARKVPYFIQLVYRGPLEVSNVSVGRCRPAFMPTAMSAVFGISPTCGNPNTVNFQGADLEIYGNVHSNGSIKANGSDQVATGNASYVSGGADDIFTGSITQVGIQPDPLASVFSWNALDVGGRIYNAALAKSMQVRGNDSLVHVINGNLTASNLEGYYLVRGNVNVSDAVVGSLGVTIVAEGTVDFHTTREAGYFISGLLLYTKSASSCNGQGVLSFRGPTGNGGGGNGNSSRQCGPSSLGGNNPVPDPDRKLMRGVIYAPNGLINFSVPRSNLIGALVGGAVSSSAARSCIWYDERILDPIPPQVEIAQ